MSLSRRKRVLETALRIVVGSLSDRCRIVVGSLSDRCRIVVSFVCGVGRSSSFVPVRRLPLFRVFATAPIVTLRRSSRRIDCSARTDRYTRADRYVAPIAEEEKVVTSLAVCAFIPVSSIERIGSIDRSDRSVLLVVLSC